MAQIRTATATKPSAKSNKKVVQVRILNQEYKISTDASEARAQKVAKYLNDSVREVLMRSPGMSEYKALVLAALNMTDKLFAAEEKHNRMKADVAEKSEKMLDLLSDVIS